MKSMIVAVAEKPSDVIDQGMRRADIIIDLDGNILKDRFGGGPASQLGEGSLKDLATYISRNGREEQD